MGIAAAMDKTMESPTIEAAFGAADETAEMPAVDDEDAGTDEEFGALDIDEPDAGLAEDADAELREPTSLEVDLSGLTDEDLELDTDDQSAEASAASEPVALDEDAESTLEQLDNTGEFLTPEDMGKTIAEVQDADLLDESDDTPEFGSGTVEQPDLAEASEGDTAEQPGVSVDDLAGDLEELLEDGAPEDATMTEVGTKLDLARAYIDMGDPDGARSILTEVIDEGGDEQQQQARQLLAEIDD
jgi:pilus assembly protein FimV